MELAVHEFPLTFFTTLAPLGAGAFFMLALSFCFADFSKDQLKKIDRLTIIPLLVALWALSHRSSIWRTQGMRSTSRARSAQRRSLTRSPHSVSS